MTRIPLPLSTVLGALRIGAVVLGIGVLAAGSALADEPPQESRFFEEYDKNSDGVVTEDEFEGSGEVFRLLDKDGDGKVSPKDLGLPADFRPDPNAKRKREMAAKAAGRKRRGNADRSQRLRQLFERLDADKDGVVTKAEWRGDESLFQRLDRDGNGKLDKADYPGLFGAMEMDGEMMEGPGGTSDKPGSEATPVGPEPNKTPRTPGAKTDKPARGARKLTPEQVRKRFQQLDQDADQELTAADDVNERLLERMDADQSGGVSLAEFEAAVKQAADGRRPRGAKGANPARLKKMLGRFDQDGDGRVSRDEFPGSDARFDGMDRNGDGFLSTEDLEEPAKPADKPKEETAPITPGGGDK